MSMDRTVSLLFLTKILSTIFSVGDFGDLIRSSTLLGRGFYIVLALPVSFFSRASSDFLNQYEVQFDSH